MSTSAKTHLMTVDHPLIRVVLVLMTSPVPSCGGCVGLYSYRSYRFAHAQERFIAPIRRQP